MKKYVVFILSFGLLYSIFQIVSGLLLTASFTPDFSSLSSKLSQETVFGQTSIMPFVAVLLVATFAYFLSQRIVKSS
ncbi:hypothetical protein [Gracilibacillus salinarum]|uniref:hypothetical protein n=1 Tax=Gracilibacillus salinarum TaxID=2932255 RepID=UPI003F7044F8